MKVVHVVGKQNVEDLSLNFVDKKSNVLASKTKDPQSAKSVPWETFFYDCLYFLQYLLSRYSV